MNGKITELQTMGTVDGPGIRLVVFMAGCPLRCKYCHNPETWTQAGSKQIVTPEDILKLYQRNKVYYGERGGVTFSGGEPLTQSEFLLEAVKLLKANDVHVALDTSGVGENFEEIVNLVDLIILDVKAVDPAEYLELTGKKIDAFERFLNFVTTKNKKLWLRQVIVPGLNDDEAHIMALKNYISKIPNVERVQLLPYHTMGEEKYKKLGLSYPLAGVPAMDKLRCSELESLLIKK